MELPPNSQTRALPRGGPQQTDVSLKETEIIDSVDKLQKLEQVLVSTKQFAVDLKFSKDGFAWLLQISTPDADYLVDALHPIVRKKLEILNSSFKNPDIVKVIFDQDVTSSFLAKDFGLKLNHWIDVKDEALTDGHMNAELSDLIRSKCSTNVDTKKESEDWKVRPMSVQNRENARKCTFYLLKLCAYFRAPKFASVSAPISTELDRSAINMTPNNSAPKLLQDSKPADTPFHSTKFLSEETASSILHDYFAATTKKPPPISYTQAGQLTRATINFNDGSTIIAEGATKNAAKTKATFAACRKLISQKIMTVSETPQNPTTSNSATTAVSPSPVVKSAPAVLPPAPTAPVPPAQPVTPPKNIGQKAEVTSPVATTSPKTNAECYVVCAGCGTAIGPVSKFEFSNQETIASFDYVKSLSPQILELKSQNVPEKRFKIHCIKEGDPLGVIMNRNGVERACFKKEGVQIKLQNGTKISRLEWSQHLASTAQSHKRPLEAINATSKSVSPPKKLNVGPASMYVYDLELDPPIEKVNYPFLEGRAFSGLVLFSPSKFLNGKFKSNEVTLTVKLNRNMNIAGNDMETVREFSRALRSFSMLQQELKDSWYLFPLFSAPNEASSTGNVDFNFVRNVVLRRTPVLEVLNAARGSFSNDQLRAVANGEALPCTQSSQFSSQIGTQEERNKIEKNRQLAQEKQRKKVEDVNAAFAKRVFLTTYNQNVYHLHGILWDVHVNIPAAFLDRWNLKPSDLSQPVIFNDPKSDHSEESDSKGRHFVPEFSDLINLTWEMFTHGKPVFKLFPKIRDHDHYANALNSWLISKWNLEFKNVELAVQAFTHPSFAAELSCASYQRLEFVGDAVLDLAVSLYLFHNSAAKGEDALTIQRSQIVKNLNIGNIALKLDLFPHIRMAPNQKDVNVPKYKPAADVFEALIGAIFIDAGLQAAVNFCAKAVIPNSSDKTRILGRFSDDENLRAPTIDEIAEYDKFLKNSRMEIKNKALFAKALTHKSADNVEQYERLEFLGDSVLKFATTAHVFNQYPSAAEGQMHEIRKAYIQNKNLTECCIAIGLSSLLRKSAATSEQNKMLADILEATIAVMFLENGQFVKVPPHEQPKCRCGFDVPGNFFHRLLFSNLYA
eukprot:TRINITY_DN4820_c0_g1_i1.p1 TRINITY_DN4820_c0_g1~~TRINITY_DN4820_c0_g1_i1.p1  ORF type:complete len:1129 (+),score=254.64 TRINITY_DN4820_c0_g1_i1:140-3526(+)